MLVFGKIACITMLLYIIFQRDWEPVLIQRILIGFEAILENCYLKSTAKKSLLIYRPQLESPAHMALPPKRVVSCHLKFLGDINCKLHCYSKFYNKF